MNSMQRGCVLLSSIDSKWRPNLDGGAADLRAEVARGRVLVRIQLADEETIAR